LEEASGTPRACAHLPAEARPRSALLSRPGAIRLNSTTVEGDDVLDDGQSEPESAVGTSGAVSA
jgi:hypothetical protein